MLPNLHIFGIQGSGKDTQAARLANHFNLLYLSSGELIRKRIEQADATSEHLEQLLSEGKLVPDSELYALVEEMLGGMQLEQGIIGAGLIRTEIQYQDFNAYWKHYSLDEPFAVELKISDEVALERCMKRGRTDDTAEALTERFAIYHSQTEPLLASFKQKNRLLSLNGEGDRAEITEKLYEGLQASYPLLNAPD